MAEFIVMPTLGFDMEEGTMGPWLKEIGDTVAKGDILAEIESDKVTQELQARADGVLLAQLASTGDNIPVGAYLGVIGAAGEDVSAMVAEAGGSAPAETSPAPEAAPAPPAAAPPAAPPPVSNVVSEEFPSGVKATPVARRIAQENGVNLTAVSSITKSHKRGDLPTWAKSINQVSLAESTKTVSAVILPWTIPHCTLPDPANAGSVKKFAKLG